MVREMRLDRLYQVGIEDESDFVIFLDADGSYSFRAVRDLILRLGEGPDIVSVALPEKKGNPRE